MKEHYVTLFDSTFLPQGMALYKSMLEIGEDFHLWILCFDKKQINILKKLKIENITYIEIKNFENDTLLRLKNERTLSEYCWTLTPFSMEWVFKIDQRIKRLTYIDADLFFLKSPKDIFEEFEESNKDVLITKHSFAPHNDLSFEAGKYCVQFIIIKRGKGEEILRKWKEQCINWCYAKNEDGKFGDQKYLEAWPIVYKKYTHILQKEFYALGPWNLTRYPYSDAIFYHFHGLRIVSPKKIYLGAYEIPKPALKNLYIKYINVLKVILKDAQLVGYVFKKQKNDESMFFTFLRHLRKIFRPIIDKLFSPIFYHF